MLPLLSIIIATHSRPFLLERALRSVHLQRSGNTQLLVCADEGDPATKRVCAKYLSPQDVLLAVPSRKGPAETRNAAMSQASGKFLCFLDDDDTFEDGHLAAACAIASNGADGFVFFNYRRVDELRLHLAFSAGSPYVEAAGRFELRCARTIGINDWPLGGVRSAALMVRNYIPNNAFIVHADVARRAAFDPHLPSHEDWDFLIAISKLIPFRHVDLYGPRVHVDANGRPSRNLVPLQDGSLPLDFLSIYRKWPAGDPATRSARHAVLRSMGLSVAADLL